ncbi:hypothetical protein F5144DRAFT_11400 [Chaetomium tenue]|uniref:Uncharacterized protein n=1 Tax=Chaetomium tenue TaxID=1854479 RepID=A0ACB7PN09_9PEZI|nr:hypothetical protein F5144DRAFT_11400 [Chaetomium globosum]
MEPAMEPDDGAEQLVCRSQRLGNDKDPRPERLRVRRFLEFSIFVPDRTENRMLAASTPSRELECWNREEATQNKESKDCNTNARTVGERKFGNVGKEMEKAGSRSRSMALGLVETLP